MSASSNHPIRVLSPQLANQIAAGEVVERPASVVKELVENSLDAGATQIHVEIEQGGQKRILIRDNGKGIAKDELVLALSRHATSKISDIDDLDHITSMGFRGEALASISSVSRLTLSSKPAEQSEAWQAVAEGRDMQVQIKPTAHPDGTSIEVLDLFFNTPARRKFLRTGKTEFQHIEHILKRLALTRVDVQFVLVHNQKTIFKYPAGKALAQRVEQVCGKQMLLNAVPVDYYYEGLKLSGWCSQLGAGVPTRDMQYTFVNGRMMKDKLLSHALRQVFDETLAPQSFPCYVLYLQVPPEQLDVNVHPAKHEVRFHQARKVHDLVFKAVNDAISAGVLNTDNHSNGVHNDETPNHGYIRALQTQTDNDTYVDTHVNPVHRPQSSHRGSAYTSSSNHYNADKPSAGEIKSAHELYQSTGFSEAYADTSSAGLNSDASHNKQGDALTPNLSAKLIQDEATQSVTQFMLSGPFVLICDSGLSTNAQINVLPVVAVAKQVIAHRLGQSTVSQPLLMPVSTQINDMGMQENEWLTEQHFTLKKVNTKLILQQVPSKLRQLPWAAMFSQIAQMLVTTNNSQALLKTLANSWLQHAHLNNAMLQAWLNEIGVDSLHKLINENAKALDLQKWMQSNES
jgi:DNA mismatch repair protein MutL